MAKKKNADEMLKYKSDIKFFDYRDISIYGIIIANSISLIKLL